MDQFQSEILDFEPSEISNKKRRRSLLPWWFKAFTWIFIISGLMPIPGLILALFGFNFKLSIYGLKTYDPISITGIALIAIFLLKGFTALSFWTEKDWAIKLGRIDAIIGMVVCIAVMLVLPFFQEGSRFVISFRFELVFLIFYFMKLEKIKDQWESASTN